MNCVSFMNLYDLTIYKNWLMWNSYFNIESMQENQQKPTPKAQNIASKFFINIGKTKHRSIYSFAGSS